MVKPTTRKLIIALVIAGAMALVLLGMGTAQNQGCLPWKTPIHTGGSAFSDDNKGHIYCK